MDRIHAVENMCYTILDEMGDDVEKMEALVHLSSVARFSYLLANKRNLDSELAYIAGIMHDLYAYTHERKEHALHGSRLAFGILKSLNIFKDDEVDAIVSAIRHHSDKKRIHDPFSEVLKDADVLDHYLSMPYSGPSVKDSERCKAVFRELGLRGEEHLPLN